MKPLILSLDKEDKLAAEIAKQLDCEEGEMILRSFPDGETYLDILSTCEDRRVIIHSSLDHPNDKILPLIFMAETARDLGAKNIGLSAPYLAYMRQDKRFQPGEGITANYFAGLLSQYFDWLVTVDPHLHRYHELREIYTIPTDVYHAAKPIAEWITHNVDKPLIIGPDSESKQWVTEVAEFANAPYITLEKKRSGDNEVTITITDLERFTNHCAVLVDDIISTGATMAMACKQLSASGVTSIVCIGIHAVFSGDAYEHLQTVGVEQIATCNTICHATNQIDLTEGLAQAIKIKMNR